MQKSQICGSESKIGKENSRRLFQIYGFCCYWNQFDFKMWQEKLQIVNLHWQSLSFSNPGEQIIIG